MFQSRISGVVESDEVDEGEDDAEVLELIEEAERVIMLGVADLKSTLRFGRGTRRLEFEDESCVGRRGEDVWYVLDVRRVGCILQPMAAVRKVGAVHSILTIVAGLSSMVMYVVVSLEN